MQHKALLIVTSHGRLSIDRETGLYLPELVDAHRTLREATVTVDVASPNGGAAPIDPRSLTNLTAPYAHLAENTLALPEIEARDYDAFFVVGGHGVMFDLPGNPSLQSLLPSALASGRIVAAVCHGPAALLDLTGPDGELLVAGRRVTAFSNEEERKTGLDRYMPFLLETRLRELGARFQRAPSWQAQVVADGNLVTGQNPASTVGVAQAVIELLGKKQ